MNEQKSNIPQDQETCYFWQHLKPLPDSEDKEGYCSHLKKYKLKADPACDYMLDYPF